MLMLCNTRWMSYWGKRRLPGHAENFDLVESHNEQWLTLEGMINEKYGIDGIKKQDLPRLKKKSIMKQLFQRLRVAGRQGGADCRHQSARWIWRIHWDTL